MKLSRPLFAFAPALVALIAGCGYVKHVPPGQSLSAATARKAEMVALPQPSPAPVTASTKAPASHLEPTEPDTEKVADAFNLGNLCLQQGRYADAVRAYQTAVKVDPGFAEAWNNMAVAYQNLGEDDKAVETFRKYKMLASH